MKKVVICASAVFYEQAQEWKQQLEGLGYSVIRSIQRLDSGDLEQYRQAHTEHYSRLSECDMVFVLNPEKHDKDGYIGPSVFAEIAFAIGLNNALGKQIQVCCLNPWPDDLPYSDELN